MGATDVKKAIAVRVAAYQKKVEALEADWNSAEVEHRSERLKNSLSELLLDICSDLTDCATFSLGPSSSYYAGAVDVFKVYLINLRSTIQTLSTLIP